MTNWIRMFAAELRGNATLKSRIIIALYRLSTVFFSSKRNPVKYFFIIAVVFYYLIVEFCWGVEIKPKTKIGWGVKIFHPTGIIINPGATIGCNVILRHGVTIGNKFDKTSGLESKCPVVGNNVEFGAHACLIGDITIGDNAIIGAMAFVDFNISDEVIVAAPRGVVLRRTNGKNC